MKIRKNQIVLFAIVVFVIFMAVSAVNRDIASGTSNNITWVIDANGKLTVSGSGDFLRDRVEYADVPPWYHHRTAVKSAVVNVTGMTDAENLFLDCTNLVNVDLSRFDTSKIWNMRSVFRDCSSLQSLNLSNFNTSNVISMKSMFKGCSSLQDVNLSSFNTANAENTSFMFMDCSNLTNLDVSNFDTAKVENMKGMFFDCNHLTNLDVKNFNTANVTDMTYMFYGCKNLTRLDLSNLNAANATEMTSMFYNCNNLTVIDTPYNIKVSAKLPKKPNIHWILADGTEITELPQDLDHSVTITRESTGT